MLTEADIRRLQAELDYYENAVRHYRIEARKAKFTASFWRWLIHGDGYFLLLGAVVAADIGFILMLVQR